MTLEDTITFYRVQDVMEYNHPKRTGYLLINTITIFTLNYI